MRRVLGILAIAICGSTQAAERFLDQHELDSLQPHPDVPGVSRYITPGADPKAYTKIIIGSTSFFFADDSKTKSMDADEMQSLSDALKQATISAAAEKKDVTLNKGPNAALLNLAVTEINVQNKKRGLLGYTPVGFVVSTAGNLSGMRLQLKDAKIEGEAVDSMTGKTIAVFSLDEISDHDGKKALSWDDLVGSFQDAMTRTFEVLQ